jgi:hypothetical protein
MSHKKWAPHYLIIQITCSSPLSSAAWQEAQWPDQKTFYASIVVFQGFISFGSLLPQIGHTCSVDLAITPARLKDISYF